MTTKIIDLGNKKITAGWRGGPKQHHSALTTRQGQLMRSYINEKSVSPGRMKITTSERFHRTRILCPSVVWGPAKGSYFAKNPPPQKINITPWNITLDRDPMNCTVRTHDGFPPTVLPGWPVRMTRFFSIPILMAFCFWKSALCQWLGHSGRHSGRSLAAAAMI